MTLTEFINTDNYQKYLDELNNSLLIRKIDKTGKVYDVITNVQIKWLQHAIISLDELSFLIVSHKKSTIKYIVQKQVFYNEPNGGEDNLVHEAPNVNFPIGHLIEFFILLKKPDELMSYLKAIRMPGPKKYASEITNIFNEAMQPE